ncbi:MerC domain-containing protein [Bernardetia sp.]|uniref:MerC domain-containing protein n=1 Tax=Bernardetia sp. TaxID=1937974 RepID=UPI0025BC06E7|nr:MerC domain-containing protein [Bernardetia sp.]
MLASLACALHCALTPFLLVSSTWLALGNEQPIWYWSVIDIIFLVLSFFAIRHATFHSQKQWAKYAFWMVWGILMISIVQEKFELELWGELPMYFSTVFLVVLHSYNLWHRKNTCQEC